MKKFNYVFLLFCLIVLATSACKKDNSNRTAIHENLYPRKMIYLKIDSISSSEDTFGIIDYYKQSNTFNYDSIGFKYDNLNFVKLKINNISSNTYEIVPNDSTIFFGISKLNKISFVNNNITQLFDHYSNCTDYFTYDFQYDLRYDSINRIKSYSYIPFSTSCGGSYSTMATYRFTNNEDTCFIKYVTEACTAEDTIIYYNDNHRSSIPCLSYTYLTLSSCSEKYFSSGDFRYPGFDLYKYSDYQYRLIKEIRLYNPYASINYKYTYQFDANNNVTEVLVKPSIKIGLLQDYKIKFYY